MKDYELGRFLQTKLLMSGCSKTNEWQSWEAPEAWGCSRREHTQDRHLQAAPPSGGGQAGGTLSASNLQPTPVVCAVPRGIS